MVLAFRNADIVTPFRVIERGTLVVEGTLISAVGETEDVEIPKRARVVECEGMKLVPGFIDLLVHGGGGYGFADMSMEAVEEISNHFYRHGTTGMLASLYSKSEPEMVADVRRISGFMRQSTGTNVWGIHLEGPFINPELHGAMKVEYLWKANVEGWHRLYEASRGSVKLMTLAPELPGMEEVMRAAAKDNVVLSVGHSRATYQEVLTGIDNGVAHVTHMFNAMEPFHHRTPGVITAALLHDELKVELIADGIHVHPAVMKLIYRVKGDGGIILITDAIRASGMPDGEYTFMDQKIFVKEKKAYLEDGTLAGSTLTMEVAVKNMVELAEVPLTHAVRMASLNGAKVLGLSRRKGILAVGKDADLVLLDNAYEVQMTVSEGIVRYSRLDGQS